LGIKHNGLCMSSSGFVITKFQFSTDYYYMP